MNDVRLHSGHPSQHAANEFVTRGENRREGGGSSLTAGSAAILVQSIA